MASDTKKCPQMIPGSTIQTTPKWKIVFINRKDHKMAELQIKDLKFCLVPTNFIRFHHYDKAYC